MRLNWISYITGLASGLFGCVSRQCGPVKRFFLSLVCVSKILVGLIRGMCTWHDLVANDTDENVPNADERVAMSVLIIVVAAFPLYGCNAGVCRVQRAWV